MEQTRVNLRFGLVTYYTYFTKFHVRVKGEGEIKMTETDNIVNKYMKDIENG